MLDINCDVDKLRGGLHFDYPFSRWGSWRAGGVCDCFYIPAGFEDFAFFLRHCIGDNPLTCIGLGSNLLVRDGGVRGIVISTRDGFGEITHEGGLVYAQAGVNCARLARYCARHGLSGLGFIVGIPGSVGGALAMNAGAFGGEIWERVVAVETVDRGGRLRIRQADEFEVGYREVKMPEDEWFAAARFELSAGTDSDELRGQLASFLQRRKRTQPIGKASCGSVFRNPAHCSAAGLIERCGLKEYTIGDAQVSAKHANFIVNQGNASAAEIEALIAHVSATVANVTGVSLQPEVRIIGENIRRDKHAG